MELLVVILIILVVSVVALPTVVSALSSRQVTEAGRLLQGAIAGARDQAIHDNHPSGFRLLLDPAWPITYNPAGTQIDPTKPLAYNRVVPIGPAPEYSDGRVSVFPAANYSALTGLPCVILEQAVADASTGLPNAPTSWSWNIRVGDKIQVDAAGPWYTVAGPMQVGFSGGNTEGFVNTGMPGSSTGLGQPTPISPYGTEWLMLVNGRDDGATLAAIAAHLPDSPDGWVDSGWDGVDQDGDGVVDNAAEWEHETWLGPPAGILSAPYTIRRRPAPLPGAREIALPTHMVIDATSWASTRERSRLPINPLSGSVDILLNPDGTIVPTTIYGVPSSVGMDQAFYHFWLADRQDITGPTAVATGPSLPIGSITTQYKINQAPYPGPRMKGRYAILTLNARSGNLVVTEDPVFDNPADPIIRYWSPPPGTPIVYNPTLPFLPAEQGVR